MRLSSIVITKYFYLTLLFCTHALFYPDVASLAPLLNTCAESSRLMELHLKVPLLSFHPKRVREWLQQEGLKLMVHSP